MKKNLHETEYVELFIDPDVPVLCNHWLGDIEKEEFQKTIEKQLKLFKKNKEKYENLKWCNDFRDISNLEFLDDEWSRTFYEKLLKEDIEKVAFIIPGFLYYQIEQKDTQKVISNSSLCYFSDYDEAIEWLQK